MAFARSRLRATACLCAAAGPARALLQLDFLPSDASHVFINIGASSDPTWPPSNMSSVITLAFEPVVPQLIDTTVDRLFVVPAAVSDESGITTMKVENANGASSSLSSVDQRARAWGDGGDRVPARVVPVVTMQSVLASLPASLTVWYLKTDTQGFDTRILKAAGDALPRIHYISVEAYFLGATAYHGVANDYCRDLLPFMTSQGFEPAGLSVPRWAIGRGELASLRPPGTPMPKTHRASLFDGGRAEARAYCVRERDYMKQRRIARGDLVLKEGNAFFRLSHSRLGVPPVPNTFGDDWPGAPQLVSEAEARARIARG